MRLCLLFIFSFPLDRVFGPNTSTQDVYEVAARPVVKAAMEGVNGKLTYNVNFLWRNMKILLSSYFTVKLCLGKGDDTFLFYSSLHVFVVNYFPFSSYLRITLWFLIFVLF